MALQEADIHLKQLRPHLKDLFFWAWQLVVLDETIATLSKPLSSMAFLSESGITLSIPSKEKIRIRLEGFWERSFLEKRSSLLV